MTSSATGITPALLVLGTGEIARSLTQLAITATYPVTVCDPKVHEFEFPASAALVDKVFAEQPWQLAPHTHAIIARGHEGDPESVASLLNHDAHHVYLVASRRRAPGVIDAALPLLSDEHLLSRLSAPAGIDLGGNASFEIALSVLAEIQWREHGGSLQTLSQASHHTQSGRPPGPWRDNDEACPGKRP